MSDSRIGFAIFLWVLLVAAGMQLLFKYEYTPNAAVKSPSVWPSATKIPRNAAVSNLVMFVHPRCPCTRATLGELARIMTRCQGKLTATVLFLKPEELAENWEKTDLWRAAKNIPGVTAMPDRNGMEAARFHALTSGQTLLYDRHGKLLFGGGITPSRGHAGDNDGEDAIVSLVATGNADRAETSVFGCSLLDSRPGRNKENENARR